MTREEKLQKAHQLFDNRNLLTELKWQRAYFERGYVSSREELFNIWIFDECIKALEQEPFINKPCVSEKVCEHDKNVVLGKIRAEIEKLNPVDYGSIYSYESHYGAKEMQNDVLEIIDKYKAESEE